MKVFHLKCKWRACKPCGILRRQRIYGRVKDMCKGGGGRTLFLTLTLPQPDGASVLEAWKGFAKMWDKWWKRMKRAFATKLRGAKYAWVLEPHKTGWPHLHCVLSGCGFLWVRTMQRHWNAVGGGNLDVKGHGQGAASYVAGYVAKQRMVAGGFANWLTENGVRWYNSSHRDPQDKHPIGGGWKWTVLSPRNAEIELPQWERLPGWTLNYHGLEPPPQVAIGVK